MTIAAAAGVAGAAVLAAGVRGHAGPPRPPLSASRPAQVGTPGPVAPTGRAGAVTVPADTGPLLPRALPTGLDIPAIGLHTGRLATLGRAPDGSLQVPTDPGTAGWYRLGPTPGEFGPAVIAGHVDSTRGPGVFFRVGALRPADTVDVRRADGGVAVFAVDSVRRYRKDGFPTVRVYGNVAGRAELRLITCGGSFDTATGHYRDDVVVFAHLVRQRRP